MWPPSSQWERTLYNNIWCFCFLHLEIKTETEKCKQPDSAPVDRAMRVNTKCLSQTPASIFKHGIFQGNKVIIIIPLNLEQNFLHQIIGHPVQETHNPRQLKSVHWSDMSFLLELAKEHVQCHLITPCQRLSNLQKLAVFHHGLCFDDEEDEIFRHILCKPLGTSNFTLFFIC